jgi:hypothetical protein
VAGWRAGWLLALAWFAVGGALVTWFTLGPRPGRGSFTAAVVILGVVAAVKLPSLAPESKGRLADRIDRLPLSFFTTIDEHRSGHSWCRPTCPVVERTLQGPALTPRAAQIQAASALHAAGLLEGLRPLASIEPQTVIRGDDPYVHATIRIEHVNGRVRLKVRLQSRRGSQL